MPRRHLAPESAQQPLSLRDVERTTIQKALKDAGGNVALAAKALGVAPSTIYRKLQAWSLVSLTDPR
jgi:transcriptional regulator of acetoin/glycerol metabolism